MTDRSFRSWVAGQQRGASGLGTALERLVGAFHAGTGRGKWRSRRLGRSRWYWFPLIPVVDCTYGLEGPRLRSRGGYRGISYGRHGELGLRLLGV